LDYIKYKLKRIPISYKYFKCFYEIIIKKKIQYYNIYIKEKKLISLKLTIYEKVKYKKNNNLYHNKRNKYLWIKLVKIKYVKVV